MQVVAWGEKMYKFKLANKIHSENKSEGILKIMSSCLGSWGNGGIHIWEEVTRTRRWMSTQSKLNNNAFTCEKKVEPGQDERLPARQDGACRPELRRESSPADASARATALEASVRVSHQQRDSRRRHRRRHQPLEAAAWARSSQSAAEMGRERATRWEPSPPLEPLREASKFPLLPLRQEWSSCSRPLHIQHWHAQSITFLSKSNYTYQFLFSEQCHLLHSAVNVIIL